MSGKRVDATPFAQAWEELGGFEGTRSVLYVKCPEAINPKTNAAYVVPILEPSVEQLEQHSRALQKLQAQLRDLQARDRRIDEQIEAGTYEPQPDGPAGEVETVVGMILQKRAEFAASIIVSRVGHDGQQICDMPLGQVKQALVAKKWRPLAARIDGLLAEAMGARPEEDDGPANFPARRASS